MTSITVQAATPNPAFSPNGPRGSRWAAAAALALLQGVLRLFARAPASAPHAAADTAKLLSQRRREAARVRRYANEMAALDPRVAAELLAACDRHEREE